jgi:hypothetical protein
MPGQHRLLCCCTSERVSHWPGRRQLPATWLPVACLPGACRLEVPAEPGEAQQEFNIEPEGSFIFSVKVGGAGGRGQASPGQPLGRHHEGKLGGQPWGASMGWRVDGWRAWLESCLLACLLPCLPSHSLFASVRMGHSLPAAAEPGGAGTRGPWAD